VLGNTLVSAPRHAENRPSAGPSPAYTARQAGLPQDRGGTDGDAEANGNAWDLWPHLRLQYLRTVWSLTARRARAGQQFDAAAVVAAIAAALERAILSDWARVCAAPDGAAGLSSWCRSGLQQVVLDRSAFQQRWLAGGELAHLEGASGRGALRVHVPRALGGPAAGAQ